MALYNSTRCSSVLISAYQRPEALKLLQRMCRMLQIQAFDVSSIGKEKFIIQKLK